MLPEQDLAAFQAAEAELPSTEPPLAFLFHAEPTMPTPGRCTEQVRHYAGEYRCWLDPDHSGPHMTMTRDSRVRWSGRKWEVIDHSELEPNVGEMGSELGHYYI